MSTTPTDNILSNPLKENSQQYLSSHIKEPCLNDIQHNNAHDINTESDYWHYNIGSNVIPVDSKNKRTFAKWKDNQSNPTIDEQHETKKKNGDYKDGIAVLAGKIWRGPHKDKHLVVVDLDNKKGIDEFIEHCFPNLRTLEELAQQTVVEQHSDNKEKAHVYFIVEKPLINRGSVNSTNNKRNDDSIPIIEIKSQGKSFVICSPSAHKNGFRYEIIDTKTPMVLDNKQSEQLQENINQIYKKYGETDKKDNNGLTLIDELLKEDCVSHEGSRHSDLLRIMESNIQKYKKDLSLEEIKKIGYDWNQEHCQPPLDDKEVERQWECACKFIKNNSSSPYENTLDNGRFITKKIRDNPEVFYYADLVDKKIGKCYNKVEKLKDGGCMIIPIFSDIIIGAFPKKILIYKDNPLLQKSLEKTKIIFESPKGEEYEIGPYDSNDLIIRVR